VNIDEEFQALSDKAHPLRCGTLRDHMLHNFTLNDIVFRLDFQGKYSVEGRYSVNDPTEREFDIKIWYS
jgi:hypothetical protein